MPNFKHCLTHAAWIGMWAVSGGSHADSPVAVPLDPLYVQECGGCHVAFPPRLLSAQSWRGLLAGLERHFGADARMDEATLRQIDSYLASQARRRETSTGDGRPVLRITDTRWFRHEHDEVPEAVWKSPAVKSKANCAACHPAAEQGNYSEHNIRFPR